MEAAGAPWCSEPPQPLLPHQPVLLEATDSLWDTRRWGRGASSPGIRLSTATSALPFHRATAAGEKPEVSLQGKQKKELRQELSESFSDPGVCVSSRVCLVSAFIWFYFF